MNKTKKATKILVAVLIVVALVAPFIVGTKNNYMINILTSYCYYGILAASLNLLLGYTGQISMGHAAFMAIGAYGYAIFSKTLGLPAFVAAVLAIALSFVMGLVVGFACCKLSAIFLAMTTVGFFKAVNLFLINEGWLTGGANGFTGISKLTLFGYKLSGFQFYFVALALALVVFLVCYRLVRSKTGRAMQALSSAPIAAAAMGVNVNGYKLTICGISAAMAGLAGCIYAVNMSYLSADMFNKTSTMLLTMTVVGGMGSLFGPVCGTLVIATLPELLRSVANHLDGVYGVLIIGVILLMPKGLAGGLQAGAQKLQARFAKKTEKAAVTVGKEE